MKEANERRIKSGYKRKDFLGLFVCIVVGFLMTAVVVFAIDNNEPISDTSIDDYTLTELFSKDDNSHSQTNSENSETTEDSSIESIDYESIHVDNGDVYKGDLILVNNTSPYKFNEDVSLVGVYKNKIKEYSLGTGEEKLLEKTIENANLFIKDFYNVSGLSNILMYNCFITKDGQQAKYESYLKNAKDDELQYAVKAGGNDAHTGLSFKLRLYPENGAIGIGEYAWLTENAHLYGFILRYPENKLEITKVNDSNRFRYVGIPHSSYMYENDLCLEEYISVIKETDYTSPVEYFYNGIRYNIFYVKAEMYAETTEIKIQKGYSYTYSGDNNEGFIVVSFIK